MSSRNKHRLEIASRKQNKCSPAKKKQQTFPLKPRQITLQTSLLSFNTHPSLSLFPQTRDQSHAAEHDLLPPALPRGRPRHEVVDGDLGDLDLGPGDLREPGAAVTDPGVRVELAQLEPRHPRVHPRDAGCW